MSADDEIPIAGKFVQLRDITSRTDQVHPGQLEILKKWNFFLGKGEEIRIRTPTEKGDGLVAFSYPEGTPRPTPRNLELLDNSVRWLLGEKWRIQIRIGKKQVFRSSKERPTKI